MKTFNVGDLIGPQGDFSQFFIILSVDTGYSVTWYNCYYSPSGMRPFVSHAAIIGRGWVKRG